MNKITEGGENPVKRHKGITLIALVITVIVMLILVVVTINIAVNGGIISKARESAFRTEMAQIKEKINLDMADKKASNKSITEEWENVKLDDLNNFDVNLIFELVYWGRLDTGLNTIEKKYIENNWKTIMSDKSIENLYYVSNEIAGEKNKYIYDVNYNIVYKIKSTSIGSKKVHSIEELDYLNKNGNTRERTINEGKLINASFDFITANGLSYYEPDLSGFIEENTYLTYYNLEDLTDNIEITATEYMEKGKPRVISKKDTEYTFYDYSEENKVWANIRTVNKDTKFESCWVWIPRYSYKTDGTTIYTEFTQIDGEIPEGYIEHPGFAEGQKGIWCSKYEPIQTNNAVRDNFSYYMPDMTGFSSDKVDTYIEVYDESNNTFKEYNLKDIKDINEFSQKNNWFDYNKKIWANIRTVNKDTKIESWWVWIPRYAYKITNNTIDIIFVDIEGNPLTGEKLPAGYIEHPGFAEGQKGIWCSKYEPINTPN